MKQKIPFMKMSGAGNDFIAVDNYDKQIKLAKKEVAAVCSRKFSVGADGLILLEKTDKSGFDFYMKFYNSDGSLAEMCGNAARCICRFAYITGRAGAVVRFLAADGPHTGIVRKNGDVKLEMTEPAGLKENISVKAAGKVFKGGFVNTGVPHFVTETAGLEKMDILKPGREIRFHKKFAPKGANAMFIRKKGKTGYMIRSYERGVEGETLACGTGATAAAIILHSRKKAKSPVVFYAKGGVLKISFNYTEGKYTDVFLEGNARMISAGYILPEAFRVNTAEK
ncbi:MAG: diaminopimelate epimerase [Candidatus Goldiibacteriota bacterium]